MYEQAEPVRTPQAGSEREQNTRPRAPYSDPPDRRRRNTRGHVGLGNSASQGHTSSNVYEEAEAVKLENISGDGPHETDTSTDTETPPYNGAKGHHVFYRAAALAVLGTLVIVCAILLTSINQRTYKHQKDKPYIPTTVDAMTLGYKLNQTATMEQRLNEKTNMTATKCPALSHLTNGFIGGNESYGDVVNFTCDPGYKLVGPSSLTCLPDGTWNGNSPTCTAAQCPPLTNPINGFMTGSNSYGDVVNFTCEPGYKLAGTSSLICLSEGTWNGNSPTCAGKAFKNPF
ncbi:sushi, von Willebrand factor type A, EGF and pentraxin domain-containing protein 1-like [Branchiostoma floridae x Branchiostoma belcheri]